MDWLWTRRVRTSASRCSTSKVFRYGGTTMSIASIGAGDVMSHSMNSTFSGRGSSASRSCPSGTLTSRRGGLTIRAYRRSSGTIAWSSDEETGVGVDRGLTTEVREEDVGVLFDLVTLDHVDEAGERLALVHRVGDHGFQGGTQPHRLERALVGDTVGAGVIARIEDDLLVVDLAPYFNEGRGVAREIDDEEIILDPRYHAGTYG